MFEIGEDWTVIYLAILVATLIGGSIAFIWKAARDLSKSGWAQEKEAQELFREDFVAFRDMAYTEIERLKDELKDVHDRLEEALKENYKLRTELMELKKKLVEVEKNTNTFSADYMNYKNGTNGQGKKQ